MHSYVEREGYRGGGGFCGKICKKPVIINESIDFWRKKCLKLEIHLELSEFMDYLLFWDNFKDHCGASTGRFFP